MQFIKELEISTGHRLHLHNGGCSNFHGHNYQVKVLIDFLTEDPEKFIDGVGYYLDFSEIKNRINTFYDHRFLMFEGDPLLHNLELEGNMPGLRVVNYAPTVENITKEMTKIVGDTVIEAFHSKEIKGTDENPITINVQVEAFETAKSRAVTDRLFQI